MNSNILVIMSDNRDVSNNYDFCDYNTLTAYINFMYCKENNYDFKYLRPGINNEYPLHNCVSIKRNKIRHGSWSKLISTMKVMSDHKKYDFILYLDSDCIFNNFNKRIENHFPNLKSIDDKYSEKNHIFFLNDKPWHPLSPCAGFFYLKNNEKSFNILKTWYGLDDEIDDHFNMNHCWEQFSLYRILNLIEKDYVLILDDNMFLDVTNDQFLRHIGSHEKNIRNTFFKHKIKEKNIESVFDYEVQNLRKHVVEYDTQTILKEIYD